MKMIVADAIAAADETLLATGAALALQDIVAPDFAVAFIVCAACHMPHAKAFMPYQLMTGIHRSVGRDRQVIDAHVATAQARRPFGDFAHQVEQIVQPVGAAAQQMLQIQFSDFRELRLDPFQGVHTHVPRTVGRDQAPLKPACRNAPLQQIPKGSGQIQRRAKIGDVHFVFDAGVARKQSVDVSPGRGMDAGIARLEHPQPVVHRLVAIQAEQEPHALFGKEVRHPGLEQRGIGNDIIGKPVGIVFLCILDGVFQQVVT